MYKMIKYLFLFLSLGAYSQTIVNVNCCGHKDTCNSQKDTIVIFHKDTVFINNSDTVFSIDTIVRIDSCICSGGGGGFTPPLNINYNGVGVNYNTLSSGNYFATNYKNNGTNKWQIGNLSNNTFYLYNYTNALDLLSISENGTILHRVSNSADPATYKLWANKNGLIGNYVVNTSTGNNAQAYFRAANGRDSKIQLGVMGEFSTLWGPIFHANDVYLENEGSGNMEIVNDSLSNILFFTNAANLQDSSAIAMTINKDQQVAIGSFFPQEKLTVKGRVRSTTSDIVVESSTRGLILKDSQSPPHYWRISISILGILTTTDLGTSLPSE